MHGVIGTCLTQIISLVGQLTIIFFLSGEKPGYGKHNLTEFLKISHFLSLQEKSLSCVTHEVGSLISQNLLKSHIFSLFRREALCL